MDSYIDRGMEATAREYLAFSPVVHITGARQVGKSTLTRHLGLDDSVFVTLDDPAALSLAEEDPKTFVRQGGDRTLIIDEIQRMPSLSLALKAEVDNDRRPGRFIITGSSDYARGVGQKDSLAGRIMDIHLHPLSQQELAGSLHEGTFADRVTQLIDLPAQQPALEKVDRSTLVEKILAGGYPIVQNTSDKIRKAWLGSYTDHVTIVEETLARESAQPALLQSLLRLIAARQASELVPSKLAREAELPASSVRNHVDTLDRLFLISQVKAWKANLTSREVSKPKAWVTDSGLASYLAKQNAELLSDVMKPSLFGHLTEALVLQELCAQQGWSEAEHQIYHWRDSSGAEVDIVLEFADGTVAAIEVKSGSTIKASHTKHLQVLREKLGSRFIGGFVLAPIEEVQLLGERLIALPLSLLWSN